MDVMAYDFSLVYTQHEPTIMVTVMLKKVIGWMLHQYDVLIESLFAHMKMVIVGVLMTCGIMVGYVELKSYYKPIVSYTTIATMRIKLPGSSQPLYVYNEQDNSYRLVGPDFTAPEQQTVIKESRPMLPFYVTGEPMEEQPEGPAYVEQDTVPSALTADASSAHTNAAYGRRLKVETTDPRILLAVNNYNDMVEQTPTCAELPNGQQYCIPVIQADHENHPRQVFVRQHEVITQIRATEAKANIPYGNLVVSGFIESRWGDVMGDQKGGYCNAYGYCFWFQFGKAAWVEYGTGEFWPNVINPKLHLKATIALKCDYGRRIGKDCTKSSPYDLYRPHQQGPAGALDIDRIAAGRWIKHDPGLFHRLANNIPTSVTKGIVAPVQIRTDKRGKTYKYKGDCARGLKASKNGCWVPVPGVDVNHLGLIWDAYWRANTVGHAARILPILLEEDGIPYSYY